MLTNKNLYKTRLGIPDDEYYTELEVIEDELKHYAHHFKDKTLYLNCDSDKSNFYVYFTENFKTLGLKKLIATSYSGPGDICSDEPVHGSCYTYDGVLHTHTYLDGDGDYKSKEAIQILKAADIVVTNPPFSKARYYVDTLMSYHKKFLVLGHINWGSYHSVFQLIKKGDVWLGVNRKISHFTRPSGEKATIPCYWYTNLTHGFSPPFIPLTHTYDEKAYSKYDNFDALEIARTDLIPKDYPGAMGVPISFLVKHNPEQFELLGSSQSTFQNKRSHTISKRGGNVPIINGKYLFARLFIRNRHPG